MIFTDLRLQYGLTRYELSLLTKRSPGYLLKAEAATFPSPPAALLQYYVSRGHQKSVLASAYRQDQRSRREQFLQFYLPAPNPPVGPFRLQWAALSNEAPDHPTQYGLSQGLCVPASAVFRAEKPPYKPLAEALLVALADMIDYCSSGRANLEISYAYDVTDRLLRLSEHYSSGSTDDVRKAV